MKGEGKETSGLARMAGSGTAGLLELILFHPVDTIAKRLMTNEVCIYLLFVCAYMLTLLSSFQLQV